MARAPFDDSRTTRLAILRKVRDGFCSEMGECEKERWSGSKVLALDYLRSELWR
jgi:hypothetical protein